MKLKNIKRKRLNNKGFTLIELLAVVVILAVVMGIAMTSVLSAMNKSRGGSLADTASIIAQAFNQKRTEALVDGIPNNVYGDNENEPMYVEDANGGYNFQTSSKYYIDPKLADTFNISPDSYELKTKNDPTTDITTADASFITFNDATGKFIACMVANDEGNYYVSTYTETSAKKLSEYGSTDDDIKDISVPANTMVACSDGTTTW